MAYIKTSKGLLEYEKHLLHFGNKVMNKEMMLDNLNALALYLDKIDINSYHKYFKDKKLEHPLPHLIIVIDEFAQLKSQHPEFMAPFVEEIAVFCAGESSHYDVFVETFCCCIFVNMHI